MNWSHQTHHHLQHHPRPSSITSFDMSLCSTITIFDENLHAYSIEEQNNEHTVILINQLTYFRSFDKQYYVHCTLLLHVLLFGTSLNKNVFKLPNITTFLF